MIKILCGADVHLGRRASVFGKETHATRDAWERFVQVAIREKVDVCLLAGDLIDRENRFFEAYGPLEWGIRMLSESNIPVVAIAGNHDGHLLSHLHKSIGKKGFYLLGGKGEWERLTLTIRGKNLHIDGWSFTSSQYSDNPFTIYNLPPYKEGEVGIGLLHCDFGGKGQIVYAPVAKSDFTALPHKMWVLGHIHIPKKVVEEPLVLYCGTLQGLDLSEKGERGAHLLSINEESLATKSVPLASLRWEEITCSLTDVSKEDLSQALFQEILTLHKKIEEEEFITAVGIDLVFQGRSSFFSELPQVFAELKEQFSLSQPKSKGGEITYHIEKITNRVSPDLDLKELSLGEDPLAYLARDLIDLKENPSLLQEVEEMLRESQKESSYFSSLPLFSQEEIEELIQEGGYLAVETLLHQKSGKVQ